MRDRLIELLRNAKGECLLYSSDGCFACPYKEQEDCTLENIANYLLAKGVIVTPCIALVEQFIKDGEFDRKRTAHNGRTAVVYVDRSKWNDPLIDITEQFYSVDKAVERILALKERENNG